MGLIELILIFLPFLLVLGAVTGKPRHGKNGRFTAGAVNLRLQGYQVTDKCEDADTTNIEGAGFAEEIDGIRSADVSANGVWDAARQPYVNPPNFVPGTFLVNVTIYVNVTDTTNYAFPSFFVVSVAVTINVHQAVQIALTGKSDGTFTPPAGNN